MFLWLTDIQRFSLHDGPGIRTTAFFQGCPLRCLWCQNPECQVSGPKLRYTAARCINCGACVPSCPHGAHSMIDGKHQLDWQKCDSCGRCVAVCPTGALALTGRQATPEEIMAVVRRDKQFYQSSGGGLTLSGGEPLAQAKGAQALLQLAKAEGIHTAIETCGEADWQANELLEELVDLWLYDIKHTDSETHRLLTGVHNCRILANLAKLLECGAKVILRVPIIPGQNDNFISHLVDWIKCHPGLQEIHLMPYNHLAESKYEPIGQTYPLAGTQPLSQQELQSLVDCFAELSLPVRVGG